MRLPHSAVDKPLSRQEQRGLARAGFDTALALGMGVCDEFSDAARGSRKAVLCVCE